MKRYSREMEKALIEAIKEKDLAGRTMDEIAQDLNSKGLKTANEGDWTPNAISYFITSRKRYFKPSSKKEASPISRSVVESLLSDPHLNNEQRCKMLGAYVDTLT